MENVKIARSEQFLFFPQQFLLSQIIVSPFAHIFDIISFFAAELEEPKIGILSKGLGLVGYFRLFIVATGCPSERCPQKMVSCYEG